VPANDLNCVGVPLNPTHSLSQATQPITTLWQPTPQIIDTFNRLINFIDYFEVKIFSFFSCPTSSCRQCEYIFL